VVDVGHLMLAERIGSAGMHTKFWSGNILENVFLRLRRKWERNGAKRG